MKILALSGSLRAVSINTALLRTAARVAPVGMEVTVFEGMGNLPLFNPELEVEMPDAVVVFRAAVAEAEGVLIASPEYAHGVTGVMKNALDWLVSFEPFVYKPVVVLNAAPRAHHADTALREILKTMSATLVGDASCTISLLGTPATEEGMMASPKVCEALREVLEQLQATVLEQRSTKSPAFPLD